MTKSQNTKNEQQKDLCITSEQLTEQWKKGEMPNGYYWIRLYWGGMIIMAYYTGFDGLFELDDHYYDSDEISEILAPVPTFEEWQASEKYNKHLEDVERLEKENKELKKQVNHLSKTQAQAKDVIDIEATRKIKQLEQIIEGQKQIIESQKQTNLALIKRLEEKVTNVKEALDFLQAKSSELSIKLKGK